MNSPLDTLLTADLWAESDGSGQLKVGPRRRLTDAHRAFVAAHRAAILAQLEELRLEETTANILALTPDELTLYRRELAEASPNDPWLAHDTEALARADARRRDAIPATCKAAATCGRSGPCRGFLTGGACTPAERPRPEKEAA